MFIVQGISKIVGDRNRLLESEHSYDDMLTPETGIVWNIYLEGEEDTTRRIHTQLWRAQQFSEAFGVSAGFQEHRRRLPAGSTPSAVMGGPLSPGYWTPIVDRTYENPPQGRERGELGVVMHRHTFLKVGREHEFDTLARQTAEHLAGTKGVYAYRAFRNLGQPNAVGEIIHWKDDATASDGEASLAHIESERVKLVDSETTGRHVVVLFREYPEIRQQVTGS